MASPVIGPMVFFVFAFITSVILLNLFVTLIISSFQSVKADIEKQCNDYEIISFMGRKVKGFFGMGKGDARSSSKPLTVDAQIHAFPEKVSFLTPNPSSTSNIVAMLNFEIDADSSFRSSFHRSTACWASSTKYI